jgi:hypothetical protein
MLRAKGFQTVQYEMPTVVLPGKPVAPVEVPTVAPETQEHKCTGVFDHEIGQWSCGSAEHHTVPPEPVVAVAAPEPVPEPVVAVAAPEPVPETVPEPTAAPEPVPEPVVVVAAPEPVPEPVVVVAAPEPVPETVPEPEPAVVELPVAPEPEPVVSEVEAPAEVLEAPAESGLVPENPPTE